MDDDEFYDPDDDDNGCECGGFIYGSRMYFDTYIMFLCDSCGREQGRNRCLATTKSGEQCKNVATDGWCANGADYHRCDKHPIDPYDDPLFMAAAAQAANEVECR